MSTDGMTGQQQQNMYDRVVAVERDTARALDQMSQLGAEVTVVKNEMNNFAKYVESEKGKFGDVVAAKIVEHQQAIEIVVSECERKFRETESNLQMLYVWQINLSQETKNYVEQLAVRLSKLEANGGASGMST